MVIKDRIVGWYLRNVLLSKSEIIQTPGFICEHMGKQKQIFLRELAIPEDLLVEIEKHFDKKILYEIGKKFGYRYALISDFSKIDSVNKKEFLRNAYFLVRYIETVSYGTNLLHKVEYDKRIFRMKMKNYVICRKSGKGHLFSTGGTGGIWSYVTGDPSVESVQIKCQGRGDKSLSKNFVKNT
jgi:hypothetical protein